VESIVFPDSSACALHTNRWHDATDETLLRFEAGGTPFARIKRASARLILPPGKASGGAAIEVEAGGLEVRGYIDADTIDLRPAKPFVMNGFVIPSVHARLRWTEAASGELTVTHELKEGIEVLTPLRVRRPCDDFSIDDVSFDPEAALPKGKTKQVMALRSGPSIPLSIEPGGAPVARLVASTDSINEVTVLETRGAASRIATWVDDSFVFGWVKSASLTKPRNGFGEGYGVGGLGLSGRGGGVKRVRVHCPDEVPVVAQVGEVRRLVGTIRQGAAIYIVERRGPYSVIEMNGGGAEPLDNALFLVANEELQSCKRGETSAPQ